MIETFELRPGNELVISDPEAVETDRKPTLRITNYHSTGWSVTVEEAFASVDDDLRDTIVSALEGDSNDADHDALVEVAEALGISYEPGDA